MAVSPPRSARRVCWPRGCALYTRSRPKPPLRGATLLPPCRQRGGVRHASRSTARRGTFTCPLVSRQWPQLSRREARPRQSCLVQRPPSPFRLCPSGGVWEGSGPAQNGFEIRGWPPPPFSTRGGGGGPHRLTHRAAALPTTLRCRGGAVSPVRRYPPAVGKNGRTAVPARDARCLWLWPRPPPRRGRTTLGCSACSGLFHGVALAPGAVPPPRDRPALA